MVAHYVNDPHSSYPYSAIVHVTVTFSDGYIGAGSGVMVGRNDVLTASHVVYRPGADAVEMEIAPGSDGWYDHPYGTVTNWGHVNYYQVDGIDDILHSEAGWDVAIIGLRENTGYTTGWFGISTKGGTGTYTITGYPSAWEGIDGSPYMVTETNGVTLDGAYSVFDIGNFDVSPGSSGSPLWHEKGGEPYVVGVVSTRSWAADLGNTFQTVVGWMEGNDTLVAAAPGDTRGRTVFGTEGDDTLSGGQLDDTVHGYSGNDALSGLTGSDVIYGNKGLDRLAGHGGNDSLYGGQGEDEAWGGVGVDLIYGNLGADTLHGENDTDILYGGQGGDVILGNHGIDVLIGNRGNDTLSGGIDEDWFKFGHDSGVDVIVDFNPDEDMLLLKVNLNGSGIVSTHTAHFNLHLVDNDTVLDLGAGNEIKILGLTPADVSLANFEFY